MKKTAVSEYWRKIRHFIWEDNSFLSWAGNVLIAFVIIKFLVYPGLGFVLSTGNPVVAVVSCSMEHGATNCGGDAEPRLCGRTYEDGKSDFDSYWERCGRWYEDNGIMMENFSDFRFSGGFNKGDLMILKGTDPEDLEVGDVIVFRSGGNEPIIHRITSKRKDDGFYRFQTKGDNNGNQLAYEKNIHERSVIGRAVLRVPLLGYVKIIFTEIVGYIS